MLAVKGVKDVPVLLIKSRFYHTYIVCFAGLKIFATLPKMLA